MAVKKVFACFDWEIDKNYKFLLDALNARDDIDLWYLDASSTEISSNDIGRIKAVLTVRIKAATHMLVIIGKEANKLHKDYKLIGFRNWQNFEIAQGKANAKKFVAIKIDKSYESPEELLGAGASWAMSFTVDAIAKALNAT